MESAKEMPTPFSGSVTEETLQERLAPLGPTRGPLLLHAIEHLAVLVARTYGGSKADQARIRRRLLDGCVPFPAGHARPPIMAP